MNEYINKNELLENLADLIFDREIDGYFNGVCDAQVVVSTMPSADVPRWIPTVDALPDEEGLYFVTELNRFGDAQTCLRYYNIDDGDGYWSGNDDEPVIAWMALPEIYNGGNE